MAIFSINMSCTFLPIYSTIIYFCMKNNHAKKSFLYRISVSANLDFLFSDCFSKRMS